MGRYTRREIEEAKMLGRKVAALKNKSPPPLSRLKRSASTLLAVIWFTVRTRARNAALKMFDRTICPVCEGSKKELLHVVHDEFFYTHCRLCRATGHVGWQERESHKWGQALLRYRLSKKASLQLMQHAIGARRETIEKHENGLVPLDDWIIPLYNRASYQLDKERQIDECIEQIEPLSKRS